MRMKNKINEGWRLYKEAMIKRLWAYQERKFRSKQGVFEKTYVENTKRPPVFLRDEAELNVLVNQEIPNEVQRTVRDQIQKNRRHRWFASMSSSQALAQSVFGNLYVLGKLECLAALRGADGNPLFIRGEDNLKIFEMEKVILYLGETSRKTNIDVFLGGKHQIAIECKLTETEIGTCSRPRMRRNEPNYDAEFCDGRYCRQRNRTERCSLTQIGVKYWRYIPEFFKWDPSVDYDPCPLNSTYQLVRNVLSGGLRPKEGEETEPMDAEGHAVLVCDERNPQFREGGEGWQAYLDTKNALKNPSLLQTCTWQKIIGAMAKDEELDWLVQGLSEKYGLEAENK